MKQAGDDGVENKLVSSVEGDGCESLVLLLCWGEAGVTTNARVRGDRGKDVITDQPKAPSPTIHYSGAEVTLYLFHMFLTVLLIRHNIGFHKSMVVRRTEN